MRGPLSEPLREDTPRVAHAQGAAWRRRQRRLRAHWRHEQLTLQMLLATYQHHAAPRGQKQVRSGVWEHEMNYTAKTRNPPTPQPELFSLEEEPGGGRPAPLPEVAGWQERLQRHTVEHVDVLPYVQILDAPVPQLVDSTMDFFRCLDLPVAEQVIDVPTISPSSCPSRAVLWEPQMVEQLVDVPMQHIVELLLRHPVDFPVVQVEFAGGGQQGFLLSGQRSVVEHIVDIPAASRGFSGGLHGFPPRTEHLAADCGADR